MCVLLLCAWKPDPVTYSYVALPGMCGAVEKSKPIINSNEVDISKIRS